MKVQTIFPYQQWKVKENSVIFTNNWKIVPNFRDNQAGVFFLNIIDKDENIIQVWFNFKDINNVYKAGQYLINQEVTEKYNLETDFLNTLSEKEFKNFLDFLNKEKIEFNLIITPAFSFINKNKLSINDFNYSNLEHILRFLEIKNNSSLKNIIINQKIIEKYNFSKDNFKEIKDDIIFEIFKTDIISTPELLERTKIIVNILKQEWNFWENIYNEFWVVDNNNDNNDNENIPYLFYSSIISKDIKLPKFFFEDKEFDEFVKNNKKKEQEFNKVYLEKNKQEETSERNILFFKYGVINWLIKYFKRFNVQLDEDDFIDVLFDTNFFFLAEELKKTEYIENLETFREYLLDYYKNKSSFYNKIINKYWKEKVLFNWKEYFFKEYFDRILYEFVILYYTGYINYLLIVQDYIQWAKDNLILVWPGRWSAAGSLLVFLLWITNIDPVPYDLMFERFLNPARVSPPDIDVDFEDQYRSMVLAYTQYKYWIDKVFKIWTFATLWIKSWFVQASIYYWFDPQKRLKIQNIIEDFKDEILSGNITYDLIDKITEAANVFIDKDEKEKLFKIIKSIKYINKWTINVWLHACGVIISPYTFNFTYNIYEEKDREYLDKLYSIFPEDFTKKIMLDNNKEIIKATLIEWPDLEGVVGLLKFDFLWLSTLTLIKKTIELINKKEWKNIDPLEFIDNIVFNKINDQKVFEIFQQWFTTGVFQFESPGMKKFLKQLKPDNIEDIVAMNALYRPWPIWFIPLFIKRKWVQNLDNLWLYDILFEWYEIFTNEIKKSIYKIAFKKSIVNKVLADDKIMVKEKKLKKILLSLFKEWLNEQDHWTITYNKSFFWFLKDFIVQSDSIININWIETKKRSFIDFLDDFNIGEILKKLDVRLNSFFKKLEKIIKNNLNKWLDNNNIDTFLKETLKENEYLIIKESFDFLRSFLKETYKINFLDVNLEKELIKKYWKEKIEEQKKILKSLEQITNVTYGIFVYQEQLMNLSKILAWFSSNGADKLRKIIGKKKLDQIPALREEFVQGAIKTHNVLKEIAEYIFDAIIKPAWEYAFNKSHAAAYSNVAFITAYLKRYYPEAFFAALMDINLSKWSNEKEIDNKKEFNWIKDILLANQIWIYKNKRFYIKNYSLENIKDHSDYKKTIDDNWIEKIDIFLNTKWYKGLSDKFLEKIIKYRKNWYKTDNLLELLNKRIIDKTEWTAILSSLYYNLDNVKDFLNEESLEKVQEIVNILSDKTQWKIKRYFIEYLVLYNIFVDKELLTILSKKIKNYNEKFEKLKKEKTAWYGNTNNSLFGFEDFWIDDNKIDEEIKKELISNEKTNFYKDIENKIQEMYDKLIQFKDKNKIEKFIIELIMFNIYQSVQANKIDYLILDKIRIINNFYPMFNEENFVLLLNVTKINKWTNFIVKYLDSNFNVQKTTFKETKYNIEYYDFLNKNKGKLVYKINNGYIHF